MGYFPLQYKYRLNTGFPVTDEELHQYSIASSSMEWVETEQPANKLDLDIEALADKLWEKIYNKLAIIPCPYCKSHNAVTNPTCVQCGGPLGAE